MLETQAPIQKIRNDRCLKTPSDLPIAERDEAVEASDITKLVSVTRCLEKQLAGFQLRKRQPVLKILMAAIGSGMAQLAPSVLITVKTAFSQPRQFVGQ
jgi:hypothetical protein